MYRYNKKFDSRTATNPQTPPPPPLRSPNIYIYMGGEGGVVESATGENNKQKEVGGFARQKKQQ